MSENQQKPVTFTQFDLSNIIKMCEITISFAEMVDRCGGNEHLIDVRASAALTQAKCKAELMRLVASQPQVHAHDHATLPDQTP